jgi:hypothetical protein
MPAPYARNMNDVATYWAPGVNDGFGNLDFSGVTPVAIACRWQDVSELARDAQGQEFTSQAIVYPDQELAVTGYLVRGDATLSSDPRAVPDAREIRNVGGSPSLSGDEVLFKVTL